MFSADDLLQHLLVERQVGDDPLQPAVLLLELAQPPISEGTSPAYFFRQL